MLGLRFGAGSRAKCVYACESSGIVSFCPTLARPMYPKTSLPSSVQ